MRFWKLSLNDYLKKGLCSADPKTGAVGLGKLKGLKTNGLYLYACKLAAKIVIPDEAQFVFKLGLHLFYMDETSIYQRVDGAWTVVGPHVTGVGYFLDFGKYGVLGGSFYNKYFEDDGSIQVTDANPTGFATPRFNHAIALNGQIIGAGVRDSWSGLTSEFIAWSKIGSDSFVLDTTNDAGYYNPNIGYCLRALRVGEGVVILGSTGSILMFYAEHTFGFKELKLPKIGSRALSASTKEAGFYIDHEDNLVRVNSKGEFTNLDYAWIMKDVLSVSVLEGSQEIVFTTSNNSFILDSMGLYSYGYKVYGEYQDWLLTEAAFEQTTVEFETSCLSADVAGMKILSEVYLSSNSSGSVTAQGFAETPAGRFLTREVPINSVDATKLSVQAARLGVIISGAWQRGLRIFSLSVNIAKSDKRFGKGESTQRIGDKND